MNRILPAFLLAALLAAAYISFSAWRAVRAARAGGYSAELEALLSPEPGPATAADRWFRELVAATPGTGAAGPPKPADPLWGFGHERPLAVPPAAGELAADLAAGEALVATYLRDLPAEVEPPGAAPVLRQVHHYKDHRFVAYRAGELLLSAMAAGRGADARRLYAASARHARVLGRGICGRGSLISALLQSAHLDVLARALAHALRHELVPAGELDAWEATVRAALAKDSGLEAGVAAEYELMRAGVRAFDKRQGVFAGLLSLYWGDGPAQVEEFHRAWRGGTEPRLPENGRLHPMVQMMVPDFSRVRRRRAAQVARREGLRVATALARTRAARGRYPDRLPAVPGLDTEAYRFSKTDAGPRLYAVGPDGVDDGGHPERDVLIWP